MKTVPAGWRRVLQSARLRQSLFIVVMVLLGGYLLLYVSHAATPQAGDVNGDQTVNISDLSILLAHFQQAGALSQGDLNANGTVDVFDLSILLANFGKSTASSGQSWGGYGPGHWPDANWRPYSSDSSPFNKTVPSNPAIHPQSAAIIASALENGVGTLSTSQAPNHDYYHPIYYAQTTDPKLKIVSGSSTLKNFEIYVPAQAQAAGGNDGHMAVIQPDGWEYDMWQVKTHTATDIGATIIYRQRYDGPGIVTPAMISADKTVGGTTAPYFGLHAGIIRAAELAAGHINHALFIVIKCGTADTSFGYGVQPPGASGRQGDGSFVYPAFKGDSIGSPDPKSPDYCAPVVRAPMGARFWLDMTQAEIDASGAPAWERTIARAMHEYGGYMGDTGGPGFGLQLESSTMYTAFGYPNPYEPIAQAAGLKKDPEWGYTFRPSGKIPWSSRMRVLPPPTPQL